MDKLPFNPIKEIIVKRIKANRNYIIVINGETGSGKTYAALTLAYELAKEFDSNFNVADNVGFNFVDLLKKTELPQNRKPGTPFVFEEVGAGDSGASAGQWQSKENLDFNSFLQTARCENQIIIMTCPCFANLENKSRQLVHMQIIMERINYRTNKSYARPYKLQYNTRTGKPYFKYPRVEHNGKKYIFKILEIDYPPKEVIKPYEKAKADFVYSLKQKIIKKEEKITTKNACKCGKCGYEWETKKSQAPKCPKCHSRDTDIPLIAQNQGLVPPNAPLLT